MNSLDDDHLLGRLALYYRLVTREQLQEAMTEQGRDPTGSRLGEILLDLGYLTPDKLKKLCLAQDEYRRKTGLLPSPTMTAPGVSSASGAANGGEKFSIPPIAQRPSLPPTKTAARFEAKAKPLTAQHPTIGPSDHSALSRTVPAPTSATMATAPMAQQNDHPIDQLLRPKNAEFESDESASELDTSKASESCSDLRRDAIGAPSPKFEVEMKRQDATEFDRLLSEGVAVGASDIHVHSDSAIKHRIQGALHSIGDPMDPRWAEGVILSALSSTQRQTFEEVGELDLAYVVEGVSRFRGHIYRQNRGIDAVFRTIPAEPPSLTGLGLPTTLAKLTTFHQGMVLLTGPSGCGKSSTMAALVNIINEERHDHILTIEDPIEYVHKSKRCIVNQRQIERHTESFARALRAALREDPDIIVIGELRDYTSISLAITAAETGHLVISTLHTNSAIRTINRLVGVFPPDQQTQIRSMLSESLRAVVSQRLLPRSDGNGMVPALEVLMMTRAVGNLIRENRTFQLRSILQTGSSQGMYLLETSLNQLVKAGVISLEEALRHAEDPKLVTL